MRLSFDDKESFMEAAGSLRFNNPASDPSASQEVGSTDSQALQGKFPAYDSTTGRFCVLGSLSFSESLSHLDTIFPILAS